MPSLLAEEQKGEEGLDIFPLERASPKTSSLSDGAISMAFALERTLLVTSLSDGAISMARLAVLWQMGDGAISMVRMAVLADRRYSKNVRAWQQQCCCVKKTARIASA